MCAHNVFIQDALPLIKLHALVLVVQMGISMQTINVILVIIYIVISVRLINQFVRHVPRVMDSRLQLV